jgi:hypothetical protein
MTDTSFVKKMKKARLGGKLHLYAMAEGSLYGDRLILERKKKRIYLSAADVIRLRDFLNSAGSLRGLRP